MHKSLDEFEFRPDPTTDYGVNCPSASKKSSHHFFCVAIDPILFKLAGNGDGKNSHRLIMGKTKSLRFLACF